MDFKTLFRILRRRWKTIAAIFVLAMVVSGVVTSLTPRVYESTAKVFVAPDTSTPEAAYAATFFVQQRVQSYAELAQHRQVMEATLEDLDVNLTPEQLAGKVTAVVPEGTIVLQIQAFDGDPQVAQRIANAVAENLVTFVEDLETPQGSDESQVRLTITTPGTYNSTPVKPQVALNLVVAGLIGLVLGTGLALLRDLLDNTVKTAEDVEAVTHAPVMASVGVDKTMQKQPLLTDLTGFSPRGEAFRMLRTNLQFLDLDNPPKSLVVTSATAGEGKTSTATNLAVALSQAGRRVLIIDGDLRRPQVAGLFGLESSVGLTTVLVGRTKLDESIQVHEPSGVHFLAGGPTPPNPTEVLQAKATKDLLAQVREKYDNVIIDAPPLLPVADAAILTTSTDGAILVASHGSTNRDELETAATRLKTVGARLFGTVVNMIPRRAGAGYGEYYYYYYDDSQAAGSRKAERDTKAEREAKTAGREVKAAEREARAGRDTEAERDTEAGRDARDRRDTKAVRRLAGRRADRKD